MVGVRWVARNSVYGTASPQPADLAEPAEKSPEAYTSRMEYQLEFRTDGGKGRFVYTHVSGDDRGPFGSSSLTSLEDAKRVFAERVPNKFCCQIRRGSSLRLETKERASPKGLALFSCAELIRRTFSPSTSEHR